MANKYSKLCIDKSKIEGWITLWCEENLDGQSEISGIEKSDRIQYTISNNSNIIKIDFIKCNGGLLTIHPKVGVNIPISTQIADSIYNRVNNVLKDSPFAHGFSIVVSEDDFEVIIELIKEMDDVDQTNYSEQLADGKAKYYLYQFRGSAGDCVTIKYYLSTKRMQIQGKPLWLFNEIVSMVSENGADMNDVVDAQLRYCNVEMEKADVYEEMESVLGTNLYKFLSNAHRAILSTAFIFSKIEVAMTDYSPMVQQALRTFEGFAKKVFNQKGIECLGDTQLGAFFTRPDKESPFTMQEKYADILKDEEMERKLTSMYNFYFKKRHPYFHATAYDFDTRIISNRNTADELLSEIISSMKTWYDSVI